MTALNSGIHTGGGPGIHTGGETWDSYRGGDLGFIQGGRPGIHTGGDLGFIQGGETWDSYRGGTWDSYRGGTWDSYRGGPGIHTGGGDLGYLPQNPFSIDIIWHNYNKKIRYFTRMHNLLDE